MNKECRDKLNEIKKQSYRLFLHNLLEKEERAHKMVRRIQFRFLTYKEEDVAMKKEEAREIIAIVKVAKRIGEKAGKEKLKELISKGFKWKVVNDSDQKVVGHMLDVCGFANISIPGKGRIVSAFKKVGEYDERIGGYVARGMRIWKGYRGYALSIISTGRQEMSVNEAAVEAASDYLNSNHLESTWNSRID